MEFTLFRIDDLNIFLIIKEDKKYPPLIVYGMLKVEGKSYGEAICALSTIAEELCASEELNELQERAIAEYF